MTQLSNVENPSTLNIGWIETYSNRVLWPLDIYADDIFLPDIIHALSMKCRFNGHCKMFYSVAQHSVLCAEMFKEYYSQNLSRAACNSIILDLLLHDSAEAYLPDFAAPIKHKARWSCPGGVEGTGKTRFAGEVERRVEFQIRKALNLPEFAYDTDLIKEIDLRMLATEKRDLMGPGEWPGLLGYEPFAETIEYQIPETAAMKMVHTLADLFEDRGEDTIIESLVEYTDERTALITKRML